MGLLSLDVGDDLLLEVKGDHAILHPAVSVPRRELPEELWKKFEARRGPKPTDIPLKTLLKEIGYRPKSKGRNAQPARVSAARGFELAARCLPLPQSRELEGLFGSAWRQDSAVLGWLAWPATCASSTPIPR
jgi:hypothetical protein